MSADYLAPVEIEGRKYQNGSIAQLVANPSDFRDICRALRTPQPRMCDRPVMADRCVPRGRIMILNNDGGYVSSVPVIRAVADEIHGPKEEDQEEEGANAE